MTLQEKELLAEAAPELKQTLEWMVTDAIKRNDETKPGDYSDELLLAITQRDLLRMIVE